MLAAECPTGSIWDPIEQRCASVKAPLVPFRRKQLAPVAPTPTPTPTTPGPTLAPAPTPQPDNGAPVPLPDPTPLPTGPTAPSAEGETPVPNGEPPPTEKPLWKKPWFWIAVLGTAATGGFVFAIARKKRG